MVESTQFQVFCSLKASQMILSVFIKMYHHHGSDNSNQSLSQSVHNMLLRTLNHFWYLLTGNKQSCVSCLECIMEISGPAI